MTVTAVGSRDDITDLRDAAALIAAVVEDLPADHTERLVLNTIAAMVAESAARLAGTYTRPTADLVDDVADLVDQSSYYTADHLRAAWEQGWTVRDTTDTSDDHTAVDH